MSRARMYIAGSVLAAVAVGVSIAMFSSGAGAATAATVTAGTHAASHADTTSVAGTATIDSPNGPVWAYDNLVIKFTVTTTSPGSYAVHATFSGSFAGFANPRTATEMATAGLTSPDPGAALVSSGSVKGTYDLTVNDAAGPVPADLLQQQDSSTGIGAMVNQLFGGDATSIVGGAYDFAYNKVEGVLYEQVG
jgi:hypothetical protein